MLLKFQNRYKKIVFDMLSLLPEMNQIARLDQTYHWYQDDSRRILYLWKPGSNNWLGLVGIEIKPKLIIIRQLVLVPEVSNREFNYFRMLNDLQRQYPKRTFVGDLQTTAICQAWERSH